MSDPIILQTEYGITLMLIKIGDEVQVSIESGSNGVFGSLTLPELIKLGGIIERLIDDLESEERVRR